ncbi:uncharacterized protein LOC130636483 [Hydractinia symbiolongicarpus]|uniref:uncharacterized protein LOC130636483 n=1 Tax=Hydractinia symbiolongicarpus TaxID=13093 RepID=UPI00254CA8DD|nr:uncharacterized protein LOC130636483 [Hydractinia symbiolongicarpus]
MKNHRDSKLIRRKNYIVSDDSGIHAPIFKKSIIEAEKIGDIHLAVGCFAVLILLRCVWECCKSSENKQHEEKHSPLLYPSSRKHAIIDFDSDPTRHSQYYNRRGDFQNGTDSEEEAAAKNYSIIFEKYKIEMESRQGRF